MSRPAVSDDRHQPGRLVVVALPQPVVAAADAGTRQPTEHERPESERVADADDAALVEHDQRVCATDSRQDALERLDRVGRRLVGEQRRQQLRVGRGGQARPAALQLAEQLTRVDEVAVVADRQRPPRAKPIVGWAFSQIVEPVVE